MPLPDYYDVLKVSPDAPAEVIKAAYRALVQSAHPDKHPHSNDETKRRKEEEFKRVQEAFELLSDPERRRAYDNERAAIAAQSVPNTESSSQNNQTVRPAEMPTSIWLYVAWQWDIPRDAADQSSTPSFRLSMDDGVSFMHNGDDPDLRDGRWQRIYHYDLEFAARGFVPLFSYWNFVGTNIELEPFQVTTFNSHQHVALIGCRDGRRLLVGHTDSLYRLGLLITGRADPETEMPPSDPRTPLVRLNDDLIWVLVKYAWNVGAAGDTISSQATFTLKAGSEYADASFYRCVKRHNVARIDTRWTRTSATQPDQLECRNAPWQEGPAGVETMLIYLSDGHLLMTCDEASMARMLGERLPCIYE